MLDEKIAVIGAGIIGLSSAVLLKERHPDLHVTLFADKFSPETTGDGSAGYWSPYLFGNISKDVMESWCTKTVEYLQEIYKSSKAVDYGVGLITSYSLSSTPLEKPAYSDIFIDQKPMTAKELSLFPQQYRYGIKRTSFYAECTKFLPMLMKRFKDRGGIVISKHIQSLNDLAGNYDIVINCPGVGAAKLVPDPQVQPIRGQVFRVKAPWIKHVITADDFYIIPNSDEVICGGTHQEGDWNLTPNAEDSRRIWDGCTNLVPSLKHATILREWVGLRPGRSSPRLEKETLKTNHGSLIVIHNYGHGGSGVTLFWGCAHDVLKLAEESLGRNLRSKL